MKLHCKILLNYCSLAVFLGCIALTACQPANDQSQEKAQTEQSSGTRNAPVEANPHLRGNITLDSGDHLGNKFSQTDTGDFKAEQLNYPRVREAYATKADTVRKLLYKRGITTFRIDLFLRLFKQEQLLEVWAKPENVNTFTHIVDYPFCTSSGSLGPKRREGDGQIPEGFYRISYFNHSSNFHLSLKLNYPNRSDRIKGHPTNPGGNIFIHGSCVTIGCIPITNPYIKELYVMAVEAHDSGDGRIPVHVFPTHLKGPKWEALQEKFKERDSLIAFWKHLRPGYMAFEAEMKVPEVTVDKAGNYQIEGNLRYFSKGLMNFSPFIF